MNRRDDFDNLYHQSEVLQKTAIAFFWLNIVIGVVLAFLPTPEPTMEPEVKSTIELITKTGALCQTISAALYLMLTLADDYFCWYNAEAARRKYNVEDAFGVRLGELQTEGYYNNSLPTSIGKYAVNVLESSFVTSEVSKKMIPMAMVKACSSLIVMLIAVFLIPDLGILSIIIQAVFTAYFIEDAVSLLRYHALVKKTFDTLYNAFVTVGVEKREQEVTVLAEAVEYEAIKAHFKIRLNSKLFHKLNPDLVTRWAEIKSRIRYNTESAYRC